jgi:hypothetical protein
MMCKSKNNIRLQSRIGLQLEVLDDDDDDVDISRAWESVRI